MNATKVLLRPHGSSFKEFTLNLPYEYLLNNAHAPSTVFSNYTDLSNECVPLQDFIKLCQPHLLQCICSKFICHAQHANFNLVHINSHYSNYERSIVNNCCQYCARKNLKNNIKVKRLNFAYTLVHSKGDVFKLVTHVHFYRICRTMHTLVSCENCCMLPFISES